MTPPGTFERVYTAIKERLLSGALRPGDRLEPALLSDGLNASVTPVRDALHRLTGERLVDAPRHEGFRVPLLSESTLRHLYAWHLDILLLATAHKRVAQAAEAEAGEDAAAPDRLGAGFAQLATASGNPELASAFRNLAERIEPYQRFERQFLDSIEAETGEIIAAIRHGDRKSLRSSLIRYHRRRQRIVPELLARLHDQR